MTRSEANRRRTPHAVRSGSSRHGEGRARRLGRSCGFDSSDEQVFGLVERAVDDCGLVALAVIHENRVLVIKYTPDDKGVVVIPCVDAAQVGRATLEYGDEMARGSIRFASSH